MKRVWIFATTGLVITLLVVKFAPLVITLLVVKFAPLVVKFAPEESQSHALAGDLLLATSSTGVRVEHHLVTADVIRELKPAATSSRPARRHAGPAARTPAPPSGLLHRAKRAFLGDGRHRPEPFPRARQQ